MTRRPNSHKTTIAGLILILAIVVLGVALGTETPITKPAEASTEIGVDALVRNFSILRDGDMPAQDWQASIPADLAEPYRLETTLARVTTAANGMEITAVPGAFGICFASESVASCATLTDALSKGIAVVEFCAPNLEHGQTRLTALLPDGAAPVTISSPGEESTLVPVPRSALVHVQRGGPAALTAPTLAAPIQLPQGDEEVACG